MSRMSRHATLALAGVILAAACTPRPAPFMGSPSRGQMITHFDLAVEARGHAINGDVEAFRRAADELAALEPARDLPAEIILQLGPMRWEAREGARARSLEDAARAAARIAETCGNCHAANDVPLGDRFTVGGPPPSGSSARHMAGLAWASRLLWDGLIGPSDRMWYAGADGLIELGALPEGMTADLPRATIEEGSRELRALGAQAILSREAAERIEVMTRVWTTCAGCHTVAR